MKLAHWFNIPNADGSKKRKREFAAAIGVTPAMITAYCDGTCWPGKEKVQAIYRETDGDVTPNDFADIEKSAA